MIGAVFLDGGYEAARDMIERLWGERLHMSKKLAARRQDHAAGMGAGARPAAADLPHRGSQRARTTSPNFIIRVELPGFEDAEGSGNSKRAAEQAAAAAMLAREGVVLEDA